MCTAEYHREFLLRRLPSVAIAAAPSPPKSRRAVRSAPQVPASITASVLSACAAQLSSPTSDRSSLLPKLWSLYLLSRESGALHAPTDSGRATNPFFGHAIQRLHGTCSRLFVYLLSAVNAGAISCGCHFFSVLPAERSYRYDIIFSAILAVPCFVADDARCCA